MSSTPSDHVVQMFSRWIDTEAWRGGYQLRCRPRHLTTWHKCSHGGLVQKLGE
ncbi:hypothetical protein AVEN_187228-1, partial [Araneus ventricosus]